MSNEIDQKDQVDPEILAQSALEVEGIVEKKEIDYDAINADTFKGIKYQDLLAKFKELGVESVWVPGSKAKTMVKNALAKIAVLKDLESKGVEGDEAQQKADDTLELKDQEAKQEANEQLKDKVIEVIKKKLSAKETISKLVLSKAQIESNLKNITANLKAGAATQRAILLEKKAILEDMLAKGEYKKEDNDG